MNFNYIEDPNFDKVTTKDDVIEYLLQLDDEMWKKFVKAMETRRSAEKAMEEVEIDAEGKLEKLIEENKK